MPVTDLYVAQFLLAASLERERPLRWTTNDSGAFRTSANGVEVKLYHTHTAGWSGLCLSFSSGDDIAYVEEPQPSSVLVRNYRLEDDMRLAEAMRALADAVAAQCSARRLRAWDLRDTMREALYQRMLFGKP